MGRRLTDYLRVTIIGGLLFLLPIGIIVVLIGKILGPLSKLSEPIAQRLGIDTLAGIAMTTLVEIILFLVAAFLAGLAARTATAQSFMAWLQTGITAVLPRLSLLQGIAQSFGEQADELPVVLVPTDAGWTLGLLVEKQHGDWCTVYLPGSPDVFSGSISFAHSNDVRRTDMKVAQLWSLLKSHGIGSDAICTQLAQMAGPLDRHMD
jgi:uncharacterized membrane protein